MLIFVWNFKYLLRNLSDLLRKMQIYDILQEKLKVRMLNMILDLSKKEHITLINQYKNVKEYH